MIVHFLSKPPKKSYWKILLGYRQKNQGSMILLSLWQTKANCYEEVGSQDLEESLEDSLSPNSLLRWDSTPIASYGLVRYENQRCYLEVTTQR